MQDRTNSSALAMELLQSCTILSLSEFCTHHTKNLIHNTCSWCFYYSVLATVRGQRDPFMVNVTVSLRYVPRPSYSVASRGGDITIYPFFEWLSPLLGKGHLLEIQYIFIEFSINCPCRWQSCPLDTEEGGGWWGPSFPNPRCSTAVSSCSKEPGSQHWFR